MKSGITRAEIVRSVGPQRWSWLCGECVCPQNRTKNPLVGGAGTYEGYTREEIPHVSQL